MSSVPVFFPHTYGSYGDPWEREFPTGPVTSWQAFSKPEAEFEGSSTGPFVAVVGEDLYAIFSVHSRKEDDMGWRHQKTWCSARTNGGQSGELGPGWFLADQPFLTRRTRELDGVSEVILVGGPAAHSNFEPDDAGGWTASSGISYSLEHDTVDRCFRLSPDNEHLFEFHDFDTSIPRQIRGKLKSLQQVRSGRFARISMSSHDTVEEVQWPIEESLARTTYEYAGEVGLPGRLGRVTLYRQNTPVRRVSYQYFGPKQLPKGLQLLKGSNTEIWHGTHWLPEQRVVFHYAPGQAQLREIRVWNASSDADSLKASMSRYEIRYDPLGKVVWIRHEGDGPPPQFFE